MFNALGHLKIHLMYMYIINFFHRIVQLIALTFRLSFVTSQTLRKKEKKIAILDIYSPFLWFRQLFVPGNRRFLDPDLPVLYDVCWHQQKQKLFLMAEFYRYPRLVWPQNDKSAIVSIRRSLKFQRNSLKMFRKSLSEKYWVNFPKFFYLWWALTKHYHQWPRYFICCFNCEDLTRQTKLNLKMSIV